MVQGHFREYLGAEWVHIGLKEKLPEHLARLHSIEKAHAVLTSEGIVGYLVHASTSVFIWNDGARWKGQVNLSGLITCESQIALANAKAYCDYIEKLDRYNNSDSAEPSVPQLELKWEIDGKPALKQEIVGQNILRHGALKSSKQGSPRDVAWKTIDQISQPSWSDNHKGDWTKPSNTLQAVVKLSMIRLVQTGCGEFWAPSEGTYQEIFSVDGKGLLLDRRVLPTPAGFVEPKLQEWWVEAYEGEKLGEAPHGRGVERHRDGTEFEGYFWKGKRHGWGILTLLDGQKVMQEYHAGQLNTTRDMGSDSQKHFAEVRLHELSRQGDRISELEAELGRTQEALAREKELHKELLVKYRYDTGQELGARTSAELQAFQQKLMVLLGDCANSLAKVTTREAEQAARQFTEDLQAVKVAHEKKMLEFQAEMDLQVERLQRKHSEQVAQLEARAAEDQKRLEDLYQNEQKEKETLTAELGQMSAQHKDRLDKLRAQQAEEMASLVKEQKKEVSARKEYYCPITCDVMQDPVVASDGFTYDREAVVNWFKRSSISPMTGVTLSDLEVRANLTLRSAIREWQDQRTNQ